MERGAWTESTGAFTEISYYSSDEGPSEEIVEMTLHDSDDDDIEEEEEEEEEVIEEIVEDESAPVKAKAPVPLHQLLANKLKNTPIKLSDTGNRKSVKDMAAAFAPPRPNEFSRSPPPTPKQLAKSSQQELEKKLFPGAQKNTTKASTAPLSKTASTTDSTKPTANKKRIETKVKTAPKLNFSHIKKPKEMEQQPKTKVKTAPKLNFSHIKKPKEMEQQPKTKMFWETSSSESSSDSSDSSSEASDSSSTSSSHKEQFARSSTKDDDKDNRRPTPSTNMRVERPSSDKKIFLPREEPNKKSNLKIPPSMLNSSDSSDSFSVSSGTDESLAAKLGDLGTPFAPLPIASNFMTDELGGKSGSASLQSASNSKKKNERQPVSWSDLLGGGNNDKKDSSKDDDAKDVKFIDINDKYDDDDSDSYESYETASSDEFETDTERDLSKSLGTRGVSTSELLKDEVSLETSDYETDTTYERKHAVAEGRTPPPPKRRSSDPIMSNGLNGDMITPLPYFLPAVNENEVNDWSNSDRLTAPKDPAFPAAPAIGNQYVRGRRRKPFENVPTAVAAELRQVSKNEPILSDDSSTPLGITGWDGHSGSIEQGNNENKGRGNKNFFNQLFKKKGNNGNMVDPEDLPPLPTPPSPAPFQAPDYNGEDDDVSNITDLFSPKESKHEQILQTPMYPSITDNSGRFSITSFRNSNSVRNTERALEGLKSTSLEPYMSSSRRARAGLDERRKRIPVLLDMQNEAVDFYIPPERDMTSQPSYNNINESLSSSRAYDSRENHHISNDNDPVTTEEIIEEVFVGYDDNPHNATSYSRTKMQENEEDPHDEKDNIGENRYKNLNKTSKRLYLIICIVTCNLLVAIGIGTWFLLKYYVFDNNGTSTNQLINPDDTDEEKKSELLKILLPILPDDGEGFDDSTSPQSEALDWLVKDPMLYTYDEQKISTRFALATFYYSTDGDNWTTNHLWLSDLDECLWYTSGSENPCIEERYSRLVLTDNNLQGTIPNELMLLSNSMVNVDLVGTFTGKIPSSIGDLAQLTSLRLTGRALSGEIPESLYTLSNLSILNLGQNLLSGGLSSTIGRLSSLRFISLMDNHLGGSVPEEIGELSVLTHFNIDDNFFDAISEDAISRLVQLETLSARNNALKGSLPSTIGNSLFNLKGLFLNNNEFTGNIPDSYGNLFNLEAGLDLSSNNLIGQAPESLGQLSRLRNLLLRDNALSGTIPLSWGKISALDTLRLDSTNFEGELPTELCDSFNEASSSFYTDCWKLDCPCCNFCCDGITGECVCRFEDSLPILCIEP